MKKNFLFIPAITGVILSFVQTGCASINAWNSTGVETFHVSETKVEIVNGNQIRLIHKGRSIKDYFPLIPEYIESRTKTEKIYTYPCSKRVKRSIDYDFRIKPDPNSKVHEPNKALGVPIFNTNQFFYERHKLNNLNPEDIAFVTKNPFILQDFHTRKYLLLIPYDSISQPDGTILLKTSLPLSPPNTIPDEYNRSYRVKISGVGITAWRLLFAPLPAAWDILTFPAQLYLFFAGYCYGC